MVHIDLETLSVPATTFMAMNCGGAGQMSPGGPRHTCLKNRLLRVCITSTPIGAVPHAP
jgi:hypothetical protein